MSRLSTAGGAIRRSLRRKYVWRIAVLIVIALAAVALMYKPSLQTYFRPGDTIKAEFSRNYQLFANQSRVKLNSLDVGVVSDVEPTDHGTVLVSMKIDDDILGKLGTAPSARIEPTTVLGGVCTVNLKSGGPAGTFEAGTIPVNRTGTPVELDRVLEGVPQSARTGIQHTVANLNAALANGAGTELDKVLHVAPPVMESGQQVFESAMGTRPNEDLQSLVPNLDQAALALTRQDGQLGDILHNLDTTTSTLERQSRPVTQTVADLPQTLSATHDGMAALGSSLDRLATTAPAFRPSAQQLSPLLDKLNPTLVQLNPLLDDVQPLLQNTRPLLQQLVPASQQATGVLNDVKGPVLDRINGPIMQTVLSPWHGTGAYQGGGVGLQSDHLFYQELAYLAVRVDNAWKLFDKNGHLANFHLIVGTEGVLPNGTPLADIPGLSGLLNNLLKPAGGPQWTPPPGGTP